MRCSLCKKDKAVIKYRHSNMYLCADCFKKVFEKKALVVLKRAGVLRGSGKLIVVAVSGGKDSLNTLYVLHKYSEIYDYDVIALLINEGISGYREYTIKGMISLCNKYKIEYKIVSMENEIGFTVDFATELYKKRKIRWKPCTVCGVFRRYLLNKHAREMGADFLATGHNLDDEAQTILLNIFQDSLYRVIQADYISREIVPKMVPRIKPLYYIYEKESVVYALLNKIPAWHIECPHAQYGMRADIRRFLNKLEDLKPGTKINLLLSREKIIQKTKLLKMPMKYCEICGEPSTHEICRACQIRNVINKFL